jgi:hypothetical protein
LPARDPAAIPWVFPEIDKGYAITAIAAVSTPAFLKHQFHLHPHTADAAVGEIAVEKLTWRSGEHIFLRDVDELRMIKSV